MKKEEIIEKLTLIFHEVFNDDSILLQEEMTANDVENWDSLTHMLLVSMIEDRFCVKFRLKELNKLKQVGDIIALLVEKCS